MLKLCVIRRAAALTDRQRSTQASAEASPPLIHEPLCTFIVANESGCQRSVCSCFLGVLNCSIYLFIS